MDGVGVELVGVDVGAPTFVAVDVFVSGTKEVAVAIGVEVAICGVRLGTPITTGVAVKMEGVFVGGRNGVGGLVTG
jgi:hypothetical protein